MLRIHTNSSPAIAKSYFSSADYYSEGQELLGIWRGEGAKRLNLHGEIRQEDWDKLCDNRDPSTGRSLTQRRKSERRVGYDFTFDVPKSVSLLYGLTGDERILESFRASVDETMRDIESEAQARVRIAGKNEDRTTGNLIWGQYVHFTSRPVNGMPDPNLHAHCFVFNATYDKHESRWKAAQIGGIKRDAPYFQAAFDVRMSRKLAELGLPVNRTRNSWEITGLNKTTLDRFSRRTAQIEELALKKGIIDPKQKAALGAKIRESKVKTLSMTELRELWHNRLTAEEGGAVSGQHRSIGSDSIPEREGAANEAVALAAEHCFERSSVLPERVLLTEALKRSFGAASLESVQNAHARAGFITADRNGRRLVTTREVLAEEGKMMAFARSGRGACRPINPEPRPFHRDWLNNQQRAAVRHVLESRDRVMLIRGAAGTGKTTMMQEAREAIEEAGVHVFAFAPSAAASRGVLRSEGFESADTVSRLLVDQKLQAEVENGIIWVDEAGLVGTKTMRQVFDVAQKHHARVVLSGDRYQHGSVERGAALRLLEEEAGLMPAEIKEIQRQGAKYKLAVKDLSEGKVCAGFQKLDDLGWIQEVPTEDRYRALATAYVDAIKLGKTALVVSPTHAEGDKITAEVRNQLRQQNRLGSDVHTYTQLVPANLTLGQRLDPVNYQPDNIVVFHQNAKGFTKGQRLLVGRDQIPLDQASRFSVFHQKQMELSAGDKVRVTHGGETAAGKHRLNNGDLFTVKGFRPNGDVILNNKWVVSKDFGHLSHGVVVTSHASQGSTVQRVFIGQSAESLPASSREQFYVSASRGKEQVLVFTDDKTELLQAIHRSDERLSATELVTGIDRSALSATHERVRQNSRNDPQAPTRTVEHAIAKSTRRMHEGEVLEHGR